MVDKPVIEISKWPPEIEKFRAFEKEMVSLAAKASRTAHRGRPKGGGSLPVSVDYSPYIHYIRCQGGYSCWGHALMACWDIQNERTYPYSPNLSINRMIWAWARALADQDIPGYDGKTYHYTDGLLGEKYLIDLGTPTEGTERTNTNAVLFPTLEGDNEAPNYKLAGLPVAIPVSASEIKRKLSEGPLRVGVWGTHFVAMIGYDDTTSKYKVIDSAGDQNGGNGFWDIPYSDLTSVVVSADVYSFVPAKPVPTARISFTHSYRQDVQLWLGVEGKPNPKRIWPNGQSEDNSRNLNLTVTLPQGFGWPPQPGNRLFLEVFDSGGHYETGGNLVEFTAAFAGHIIPCSTLATGPARFYPRAPVRFYLPA